MSSHNHLNWFLQIGLDDKVAEKYAKIFEENEIEFDQLKELDHNLLKDMGIVALGHRLKILKFAHKEKNIMEKLLEGVSFLQEKEKSVPVVGVILHTESEAIVDQLENVMKIPVKEIPHFPFKYSKDDVLIIGTLAGKKVVIMKGKYYYDGFSLEDIVFPVRLLKLWGVQKLFICSTVGSLKPNILPGDIVLIDNHINLIPNPLIGDNEPSLGPRWPHGKDPYHLEGNTAAIEIAKKNNITAHRGVYMCISGPSGSTRAELRAWQSLGADVVGHSVVPEAVTCMHLKLRVMSICTVITSEVPEDSYEVPNEDSARVATENSQKVVTILKGLLQTEKVKKSSKFIQQGEGLVLHGNKYYHKQNYTKALEFYKLALEKEHYQPAIWNIHNRLCATYTRLKDYNNALEQAELMIKIKPDHAKGYLRRGGAYFFLGRTELALQDYIKAQTLNEQGNGEDINTANLESYIIQAKEKLSQITNTNT